MLISKCKNYDPTKDKDYNNKNVSHGWELIDIPWLETEIIKLTTENGIGCNQYSFDHKASNA